MSFEALLNQTCTIQGKSAAQTDSGELSVMWSDKATGVKTRMQVDRGPAIINAIGQVSVTQYRFYFLAETDIADGDRILLDGLYYTVIRVGKDSAGHHIELLANKISFE